MGLVWYKFAPGQGPGPGEEAMSISNHQQRATGVQRQGSVSSRPSLVPKEPLSGWVALVQVLVMLGIPLALLILAKLVLRSFFPELGY